MRLHLDDSDTEVTHLGGYVKIPGPSPDEPGALPWLTREQLVKLRTRAERAIQLVDRKRAALAALHPGERVQLTRYYAHVPKGCEGMVVERGAFSGGDHPADLVPVQYVNGCFRWTPVSWLKKASPVGEGAITWWETSRIPQQEDRHGAQ